MNALEAQIRDNCSEVIPKDHDGSGSADSEGEGNAMARKRRMLMKKKASARVGIDKDPVKRQVKAFFEQSFDPVQVLLGQQKRKLPPGLRSDLESGKLDLAESWLVFAKHFDVMEWWESVGKKSFPLIYNVACLILPLPDSNGDQERTFSAATWMDGKLKKRQSDLTFEMKVLLYKNTEFLRKHFDKIRHDNMRAAEARTKEILDARAKAMVSSTDTDISTNSDDDDDEAMDEEEELMWEAYDAGVTVPMEDDETAETTKATDKSPLTITPKSAAPASAPAPGTSD